METYLLDTNVISDIASNRENEDNPCIQRLHSIIAQDAKILLPVISIAEIEFGLQKGGIPNSKSAQVIRQFFTSYPVHMAFDDNAIESYALIRSWLFMKYGTPTNKRPKKTKERVPEDLRDRVTGKELNIDERDLLIVSTAVQYNCVLVTGDSNEGMRRICEAADTLAAQGFPTELRIENWRNS